MSEPTESVEPRRVKVPTWFAAGVLITALVAGVLFVALQPERSSAPAPGTSSAAPTQPSVSSSSPTPQPSSSLAASATQTVKPLPTVEVALTANLGPRYELRDEKGDPASLCEATRFAAPFNADYGTFTVAQSSGPSIVDTTEGVVDFSPVSNNEEDGFFGLFHADC